MSDEPPRPRKTVKSDAVHHALEEASGFISAAHLHERMNADGAAIGLATVYRQLNAMARAGYADTISAPSGQLFAACRQPGAHHHHLVCESCGTASDIEPPNEDWIQDTATARGFTVTRHVFEVFGRCADCVTP